MSTVGNNRRVPVPNSDVRTRVGTCDASSKTQCCAEKGDDRMQLQDPQPSRVRSRWASPDGSTSRSVGFVLGLLRPGVGLIPPSGPVCQKSDLSDPAKIPLEFPISRRVPQVLPRETLANCSLGEATLVKDIRFHLSDHNLM